MNNDTFRICARVQKRYDELNKIGNHGFYETLFKIVLEERENALKPFLDWYDADNSDAITISRAEMGVLVGRHSKPIQIAV